jgi:hypothetical protein
MSIVDRAVPAIALGSVDLTNFDVSAIVDSDVGRAARATVDAAFGALRETTYVGVGFAVLGIHRAQTLRRELERAVRP